MREKTIVLYHSKIVQNIVYYLIATDTMLYQWINELE
jgi:hypothetical protein